MSELTERVRSLYDEKAGEYDEHYLRRTDRAEDEVLYGWLRPGCDHARVLDVGCGTALALEHLIPSSYMGVDVSTSMLSRAQARVDRIGRPTYGLIHADWCGDYEIDFGSSFDVAFSLWAFPHMSDQTLALRRMMRAVRPGGHVVVQGFAKRYAKRPNYILNGHGAELLQPTTPKLLEAMASDAGLEVVNSRGFRFLLDQPWQESLPTSLLAAGMRTSTRLLSPQRAATHLLVARRPG